MDQSKQYWLLYYNHMQVKTKKYFDKFMINFANGYSTIPYRVYPLFSKRKVSLNRLFAPKMPHKVLKLPKVPYPKIHISCPALILNSPLIIPCNMRFFSKCLADR